MMAFNQVYFLVLLIWLTVQVSTKVARKSAPAAPASSDEWEEDSEGNAGSLPTSTEVFTRPRPASEDISPDDVTQVSSSNSQDVDSEVTPLGSSFGSIMTDTTDPRVRKMITNRFNQERRKAPAADMLKLSWSKEAQDLAQKIANRCVFKQPESDAERTQFLQTKDLRCGLNMARSTGPGHGWNGTIDSWIRTGKDFKFDADQRGSFPQMGTYTAIIWSKTHKFGCGVAQCQGSGQWRSYSFYVCTFCPAGNITPEKIRKPYLPGDRCSRCPDSCTRGLCTNPCPFANKYANCDSELFPSGCNGDQDSDMDPLKEQCKATCQCRGQDLLY